MTGGIILGGIRIQQQAKTEASRFPDAFFRQSLPETYVLKTLDRYASLGELHRASLLGDPILGELIDKLIESSRNWSRIIDKMARRIRCTQNTVPISPHMVSKSLIT
ncbi:unnamed protein product [Dibothriocephalus latus]|uniref:Uncharacterized protein n=1 Tax=Dibothriocephalus latus TaxID=60516 RepID=A0A3P7NRK4_DIBLA|nr:unnamed protein product [Dibothriocephalus latus]